MEQITEAKDLIVMAFVNSTIEKLNTIAEKDYPGEISGKVDRIYFRYYEWIRQLMFAYCEAVSMSRSGRITQLIRDYQTGFRETAEELNEELREERFNGVPDFEHSVYADAFVMTGGKPDRTKRKETRSKQKKQERNTDIVLFEENRYYSIAVPDERAVNGYRKIDVYPYYVPRYIPF